MNPVDHQAWRLITQAILSLLAGDRPTAIALVRSALVTLEGKDTL